MKTATENKEVIRLALLAERKALRVERANALSINSINKSIKKWRDHQARWEAFIANNLFNL